MNKPSPKIITVWRVYLTLASILPAFAISVRYAGSFAWKIAAAAFILVFLAIYLAYIPALYKSYSYDLNRVASGVFRERTIVLSRETIQSVGVGVDPVGRIFGLASVTVYVAGARFVIPGIPLDEAFLFADELMPDWPEEQDR